MLWGNLCKEVHRYYVSWGGVILVFWAVVYVLRLNIAESMTLRIYSGYSLMLLSCYVARWLPPLGLTVPTFFIYCSHVLFLRVIPNAATPMGSVLIATMVFLASFGIAIVLKRIVPQVYAFLTANRG